MLTVTPDSASLGACSRIVITPPPSSERLTLTTTRSPSCTLVSVKVSAYARPDLQPSPSMPTALLLSRFVLAP